MDDCVRRYLMSEEHRLLRKQLRQTAIDLRKAQDEARPLIEAHLKRERERRSKGDGFVIIQPKY